LDAAAKVVKKFASKETYAEWHKPLSTALSRLRAGRIPNTYAACFCEKSDLLSQWRGYGGAEQGVAIAFNRSKPGDALKGIKATLFPVIYGQIKARSEITQALSEKLAEFETATNGDGVSEDEKRKNAHSMLSGLLPQFKHSGFKEEQEWRIVVQQSTVRPIVSFRAKAHVLLPYLKLKLANVGKLPIKYIRVGPGREQELTKRSIELYLASRSYEDVEVHLSNVPYRF